MSKKEVAAAIILAIFVTFMFAVLVPEAEDYYVDTGYDPDKHVCIDRLPSACEGELCFNCWTIYIQDFPQCCANWTDRPHPDRYETCVDEMFYAHRIGFLVKPESFGQMFVECLEWDREEFLDKIRWLQESLGNETLVEDDGQPDDPSFSAVD